MRWRDTFNVLRLVSAILRIITPYIPLRSRYPYGYARARKGKTNKKKTNKEVSNHAERKRKSQGSQGE